MIEFKGVTWFICGLIGTVYLVKDALKPDEEVPLLDICMYVICVSTGYTVLCARLMHYSAKWLHKKSITLKRG